MTENNLINEQKSTILTIYEALFCLFIIFAPITKFKESIIILLPAPVSPVKTFKFWEKSIIILSIKATFLISKLFNILIIFSLFIRISN